jgi:hypothetical protein
MDHDSDALGLGQLLGEMRRRDWTLYQWGPGPGQPPELLGAAFFWDDGAADVVVIRNSTAAAAYRTPPCRDIFVPKHVTHVASGAPLHVARTALTWDEYGKEGILRPFITPPASCVLPVSYRLRFTETVTTPGSSAPVIRPALALPSPPQTSAPLVLGAGAVTLAQ